MSKTILTINSGSSSIKSSLYRFNDDETLLARGELDRIGFDEGTFQMLDWNGNWLVNETCNLQNHGKAFEKLFSWLESSGFEIDGIGHRVVHGGPNYRSHQKIDQDLIDVLHKITSMNPLHLPSEIQGIEFTSQVYPKLPQVACFDTAFHATLPLEAKLYPIPRKFADDGIFRYGFHGLSYEYILQELKNIPEKLIIAHLGNGASMAAVKDGKSVDTTMGFTPSAGLMMGTRCGDIDPGILIYLAAHKGYSADDLREMVNTESGLQGISELSSDVKELLDLEHNNQKAKEALDLFCYRARKYIGALAAALGGCDTLVFTAGIGERSAEIRQRICSELGYLGIEIDDQANQKNSSTISTKNSGVKVLVIRTNEELMIARHTNNILFAEQISKV
ncbi:MAG: Acetate kinase [Chlamydiae bacterium]|nr:Acetate kinase [Chlamydiota bacterium]